jgi:alpha-beta hydrolase superfamily lysophospholipase
MTEMTLAGRAGILHARERLKDERSEEKVYPSARHEIFNETNRDEVLDDVLAFVHRQLSAR